MLGPAYPSVRALLAVQANHSTCLGEITVGSAGVLKGLCFIKTEAPVRVVTSAETHGRLCGRERTACVSLLLFEL